MNKRTLVIWLALLALFIATMTFLNQGQKQGERNVTISEFISMVEQGEIKEVEISGANVVGKTDKAEIIKTYCTNNTELLKVLNEKKVKYREIEPSNSGQWIMLALKMLLPLVIVIFFFRMMSRANTMGASQLTNHTHSKAVVEKSNVRFSDVAGIDEAVEDVKDLVVYLKDPQRFTRVGGRMPKGVLLMGPPGTGKTLLARALAGEADVPFFQTAGSEFVEMFVGVGASRVRDLFEKAKKQAPCIIFIDEVDGVGRHRSGGGLGNSHDEREQTLNEMLRQMDGFENNSGIIVVAATNRPDILDGALTRAGRFDRHVIVPAPDVKGREAILKVHAQGKNVTTDVDFCRIARTTPGMVGADLEKLINEAAIAASKAGKDALDTTDIEAAVEKVYLGPERRGMRVSEKEMRIVAVHEAGHAIVGHFTPGCEPVRKVTCVPRGRALGVTLMLPEEDKHLESKREIIAKIKMALGGRAAEDIAFDEVTGGCRGDLEMVTSLIQKMISQYGMSETVGLRTIGNRNRQAVWEAIAGDKDYSDETARQIDEEIKRVSADCYAYAKQLLGEKRELLDRMAALLIEKETLGETDIIELLGPRPE